MSVERQLAETNSGQNNHSKTGQLLELADQLLSTIGALATGIAINDGLPKPEMLLDRVLQFPLNITQLDKDNDLVAVPSSFDRLKRPYQPPQHRRIVAQSRVWLNAKRVA